MSRYIDAVKAAEIVSERHNIPLYELVDTFAEVPTADVKEVKHGHWSSFPAYKNNYTDMCYRCTECGCNDTEPIYSHSVCYVMDNFYDHDIEVIGNIHDNPELLKEGNNG